MSMNQPFDLTRDKELDDEQFCDYEFDDSSEEVLLKEFLKNADIEQEGIALEKDKEGRGEAQFSCPDRSPKDQFLDLFFKPKSQCDMSGDILQEVPLDEIPQILHLWKKNLPNSFIQCQAVENIEKSKKENVANPKQTLYRYGDIEKGVYVHLILFDLGLIKQYWISIYTTDCTELSRILSESKVIPWRESLVFGCNAIEFSPVIFQAGVAKELKLQNNECHLLWLPLGAGIEVGVIPKELSLEFLDFSHGAVVNSTWPYKGQGTDVYLGLLIQNNFGLGLFRKSDRKLVCSALSYHFGGIFVLHTDPELRKKGYAQLLVGHMVKVIRERGQVPFCTIVLNNTPSVNLFKKIGFKQFQQVDFIWS